MVLEEEERPPTPTSASSTWSVEKNIFADLFEKQVPDSVSSTVLKEIGLKRGILQEIKFLVSKFSELSEMKNTVRLWQKNKNELKHLYKLCEILFNIPSTSAQLERFFSISGFVCDKRRMRMTSDLVIKRAMLKANLSLFSQINKMKVYYKWNKTKIKITRLKLTVWFLLKNWKNEIYI